MIQHRPDQVIGRSGKWVVVVERSGTRWMAWAMNDPVFTFEITSLEPGLAKSATAPDQAIAINKLCSEIRIQASSIKWGRRHVEDEP